jgi:hypothetical protein
MCGKGKKKSIAIRIVAAIYTGPTCHFSLYVVAGASSSYRFPSTVASSICNVVPNGEPNGCRRNKVKNMSHKVYRTHLDMGIRVRKDRKVVKNDQLKTILEYEVHIPEKKTWQACQVLSAGHSYL